MSKRKVQIVVLSEDRVMEVFVRRYLLVAGYEARKIDYKTAPFGGGSGEQFVRERFPAEVVEHRRRKPTYWRLVVMLDADTGSVAEHEAELRATLAASNIPPVGADDNIVLLIPRRNIETWIHHLLGHQVDEDIDYKGHYRGTVSERDYCQPAVEALHRLVKDSQAMTPLPSLNRAIQELRRLEP